MTACIIAQTSPETAALLRCLGARLQDLFHWRRAAVAPESADCEGMSPKDLIVALLREGEKLYGTGERRRQQKPLQPSP
jgi:hypothetical protein